MSNLLENIAFFLHFITVDIFIPFGECTILYFLISPFLKEKKWLTKFDEQSCKLVSFTGIIYMAFFLFITVFYLLSANETEKNIGLNRIFGPYWFGYWIQPLLYFIMTISLKISKNIILRIVFSLFYILTIERFVIILTSLYREYLPSSWSMIYPEDSFHLGFGFILKITFYALMVGAFYLITKQLKKFKFAFNKNKSII